jgi:hypothetical protein
MKKLLLFLPFVFFSACTKKPGCVIQDVGVTAVTGATVALLQCKRADLVKEDVREAARGLGLCTDTGAVALNPFTCGLIVDVIVATAASKVPERWECSLDFASAAGKAALMAACLAIP